MMGHIEHHPNDETILSYAAGSLPAAMALVVGCHLQYCSACRERVAQADAVGGSLMSQLQEKPLSDGRRESMMALLDANPGGGDGVVGVRWADLDELAALGADDSILRPARRLLGGPP